MRRLAYAVAILSTLCSPAMACDVAAGKVASIVEVNPGTTVARMTPDQTRVVLAAYNAEPPVSDIKADMLYVLSNPRIPVVLLVFAAEGCVVADTVAPGGWLQMALSGRLSPL